MDCEQAANLINAWIDGEITADERTALDAHLAECAECRMMADAMRLEDADLRRVFAARQKEAAAVAERVIRSLSAARVAARVVPISSQRSQWHRRLSLLTAAAAGFLAAVVVFRPWERPGLQTAAADLPIAQLAVTTGPVEMRTARATSWSVAGADAPILEGTSVRTGAETQCAISADGGGELRLNCDTELRFTGPGQVKLSRGKVFSCPSSSGSPAGSLAVDASGATVSADGAKFDLACQNGEAVLTVVEGSATVRGKAEKRIVTAGERIKIVEGRVAENERVMDPLLDTSWIHQILVCKGSGDPELTGRVNALLAKIGAAKISLLYEDEIRRLGPTCVLPLVKFIEATAEEVDQTRRVAAAGLVADLAETDSIAELIELLGDENGKIRAYAAQGLARLTGRDHGRTADQWQSDSVMACEPTQKQWQAWWEQHKDRYPRGNNAERSPKSKQG